LNTRTNLSLEEIIAQLYRDHEQASGLQRECQDFIDHYLEENPNPERSTEKQEEIAFNNWKNQSSLLKKYSKKQGFYWFLISKSFLWLSVFVFLIYTHFFLFSNCKIFLFVTLFIFYGFFRFLVHRAEVNTGINFIRLFHKKISIPFENIREVSFSRVPLLGKRMLVIRHDKGKATLSSGIRNARWAWAAIKHFSLQSIKPEVLEHTKKHPFGVSCETNFFRILFTLIWISVLALFLFSLPVLWNMRGFSPIMPAIFYGPYIICTYQIPFLANRAKMIICGFLLCLILLIFGIFFKYFFGLGVFVNIQVIRQLCLILFVSFLLPLVSLWWRWGRKTMLAIATIMVLISFSLNPFIPGDWDVKKAGKEVYGVFNEFLVLPGENNGNYAGLLYSGKEEPRRLFFELGNEQKIVDLEKGFWSILPGRKENELILINREEKTPDKCITHIYSHNLRRGLQKITELPYKCFPNRHIPFLSPNKKFLILPLEYVIVESSEYVVASLENQDSLVFSGIPIGWKEDNTLRIVRSDIKEKDNNSGNFETIVQLWNMDPAGGEEIKQKEFNLKGEFRVDNNVAIHFLPVFEEWTGKPGILNLETGEMVKMAHGDQISRFLYEYSWDASRALLAFQGKDQLIVSGIRGDSVFCKLEKGEKIVEIVFSPDGRKIFFTSSNQNGTVLFPFYSYKLFDIERNKCVTLEHLNFFKTLELKDKSFYNIESAKWTPDSRDLLYPLILGEIESSQRNLYSRMILAQYENHALELP